MVWERGGSLTVLPGWDDLKSVDHLSIETRSQLHAHAGWDQHEIEETQIWLLVPWHRVILSDLLDDGVGYTRLDFAVVSRHGGLFNERSLVDRKQRSFRV